MSDKRGFVTAWLCAALMGIIGMLAVFAATALVARAEIVQSDRISIGGNPAFSEAAVGTAGNVAQQLSFGSYTRTYILHLPAHPKLTDSNKMPMVIMLHGAGGDGASAALQTGWDHKADEESFVAVFPDALPANPAKPASFRLNPRLWDAGQQGGRGRTTSGEIDDVGFISAVIDDVSKRCPVDPNRIYVTGFSSGGSMAFHVADSALASRVAAVAPVSGGFVAGVSSGTPPRAVPALFIIGTKDPLNPMDGGMATSLWGVGKSLKPRVQETVDAWAKVGDCTGKPVLISDKDGIRRLAYGPGRDGVEFLFWTIDGMGNHWPGSKEERLPRTLVGDPSDKLKATDAIWTFLSRHTLALRAEAP